MPGLASGKSFESSTLAFVSSDQALPSSEVRWGSCISPGQPLNEFGNRWSTPSRSTRAPGLMYRPFAAVSLVSITTPLSKLKRFVTAGAGLGVTLGEGPADGGALGGPLVGGVAWPQAPATRASMTGMARRPRRWLTLSMPPV